MKFSASKNHSTPHNTSQSAGGVARGCISRLPRLTIFAVSISWADFRSFLPLSVHSSIEFPAASLVLSKQIPRSKSHSFHGPAPPKKLIAIAISTPSGSTSQGEEVRETEPSTAFPLRDCGAFWAQKLNYTHGFKQQIAHHRFKNKTAYTGPTTFSHTGSTTRLHRRVPKSLRVEPPG